MLGERRDSGGVAVATERSAADRRALRDRRRTVMLVPVDRRSTDRRFVLDRRTDAPAPPEPSHLTDALTGLFNGEVLQSALMHELARCRRQGVMSSLVLVDVDGFDATNTKWGNAACDAALRHVAEVIRRHVRAVDTACRCGGDQFAVVLPDTYSTGAQLVGGRLVGEIRRAFVNSVIVGCRIPLTVSVGVASYGAGCGLEGALFVAAQRALSEAKGRGGDCVAVDLPRHLPGDVRVTRPSGRTTSFDSAVR